MTKSPASKRKPVVLDTITTRFLMLFVIVLTIPLFSLIIFNLSLFQNQQEKNALEMLEAGEALFRAAIEDEGEQYQRLLGLYATGTPRQNLDTLCQQPKTHICFIYGPDSVTFADGTRLTSKFLARHPEFTPLSASTRTRQTFYAPWGSRLYLFTRRPLDDGRQLVYGTPLNKSFFDRIFRHNPSLAVHYWVMGTGKASTLMPVQANSHRFDTAYSPAFRQKLMSQLLTLNDPGQSVVEVAGEKFRVTQMPLYSPQNEKLARLTLLLPLEFQQKSFAVYYLGIYIIVVVSILFTTLIAILASRTITQPLLNLVKQVDAMTRSQDLSQWATIHGMAEINQLADSFNRMLSRLQQEHRIKDEFVATLTHDLKVPLLAEKQTLRYMADGTYGELNDTQQEVVDTLRSANRSNLGLVNGILEIYRYESNQVKLIFEQVPVVSLLEEAVSELAPLATEKHIELTTEILVTNPQDTTIRGDRLEIKRTLINLVGNAIENTPKYGRVNCLVADEAAWGDDTIHQVSAHQTSSKPQPILISGHILISIQDSGIGFSSEDLPNLFRQFAANRGRNPMSIGLGLYNCYQVVRAHGGAIWVETTEGEGSAVSILLPTHLQTALERRKYVDRRQNPSSHR